MSERILLAQSAGVARVTLNAPDRGNSVDADMLSRLAEVLEGLEDDVRVVLLQGAGSRSFSTGYHIPSLVKEMEGGRSVSDFQNHPLELAMRALAAIPVPTIAVVQGNAYGAGCELALTCDLRLAAEEARFCMPPAKLGVLYSATGIRRLRELAGPAVCEEMFYTACVIHAERALAVGLANRVVPKANLEAEAANMAGIIAGNAPLSIRHTKAILRRFLAPPELDEEAMRIVVGLREECFGSEEFRQRISRMAGK